MHDMVAYLVGEMEVDDPEGYQNYAKDSPKSVIKFGGRYIARGGKTVTLEGDPPPPRVVIVEFKSLADAEAFYHSEEYQKIAPLRQAATHGRIFVVEGLDVPIG